MVNELTESFILMFSIGGCDLIICHGDSIDTIVRLHGSQATFTCCARRRYIYFVLDANMPIEWLIEAAHSADVSVYAVLQPYYAPDTTAHALLPVNHHATIAQLRAAAANFWAAGCDGLYTWFCTLNHANGILTLLLRYAIRLEIRGPNCP